MKKNYNKIIFIGLYIGEWEVINACADLKYNINIYRRDNISSDDKKYIYKYEIRVSDNEDSNPFKVNLIIGWVNMTTKNYYYQMD